MQLHNTSRLYTCDPDMTIEHGRINKSMNFELIIVIVEHKIS